MILRLTFILLAFVFTTSNAQKLPLAITFQHAQQQGLTIAKLDSTYKSAVDNRSQQGGL